MRSARQILHSPWLLLSLAAVALAAGLGLRDPSPADEPRFVLAAQQMVESGQWLVPHRGSEMYAHKPPPFMWLQAIAYTAVRDWRIAFLLPSLLAALGTLWLVHDLAQRLWNRKVAAYAGFALLATLQFGLQAKRAQIDMVLVFWTTLSLWALSRHLLQRPDWRLLALGGLAAGIGTITKGVGFLPLLLLLPWWLGQRRDRAFPVRSIASAGFRHAQWWWLPAGFIAGVSLWLLPLGLALLGSDDPDLRRYASEILFKQTGTRYAAAWHHVQPPWYYLQVIATLWLPGVLLLPWLLPAWGRRMRRGDLRTTSLLGWAALVLLFFSASPGKREVYLFPALPALCIAAAPLLPGLLRRAFARRLLLGYVLVLAAAALALGIGGLLDAGWASRLSAGRGLTAAAVQALWLWLCALGTGGLVLAAIGRTRRAGAVAVGFAVLLWIVYGIGLAPALDPSSSGRAFMQDVRARIGPEAQLGLVGWREQHLLQAVGPTAEFGFEREFSEQWRDAVVWLSAAPGERWLFALKDAVGPCIDPGELIDLGRSSRRQWVLVPGAAYHSGCVPPPRAPDRNLEDDRAQADDGD
ncbi:MAG TPA: glycosyltransferase family 39 protein [Lysobacter sp.]|nr:glycosyltransferase family 39 protein [Lysobacter sp.]